MWWSVRSNATRITGQCHKYVPYEIRPRYTNGLCDNPQFTGPLRAASIATINTAVITVAAIPRSITDRCTRDVAVTNNATNATAAATHTHRHCAARRTNPGLNANKAPANN